MGLQKKHRRILMRIAVSLSLVALGAIMLLWPLQDLGTRVAYLAFYPAIMLAGLYGGVTSGLLATLASALAVIYWLPGGQPFNKDSADWFSCGIFLLNGILISVICESMHRAHIMARIAKERAETAGQETDLAERYEKTHDEVLRLFNSTMDRPHILNGMLDILAKNHPYPVSSIYVYDEWSGVYRIGATHATPPGLCSEFGLSEGIVGEAARESRTIIVEGFDEDFCMTVETGLFSFRPAAVIICPVIYQEKRLAVLALASSRPISERGQATIEQLAVQLGVALHNLKLYDDTKQLAEQLRIHSAEIADKNAQLEQASRMKSEFLANMSHELRTPLNAIIGFSEMLNDGLLGDLSAQQRKHIGSIFDSGQHLLSLINDILDLSKIEAGKMTLDLEPVDIPALLECSISIVREKALAHHIRLETEALQNPGAILADARKTKQIIDNLLANAVKFTNDGGQVTVGARCVPRSSAGRLSGLWPGRSFPLPDSDFAEFLEISITDNGIGIPNKGLEQLFQSFSQIDSGLARKFEGTGLGLVLVKQMTELHGGTVAVESAERQGSRFTTWLPLRTKKEASPDHAQLARIPPAVTEEHVALVVETDDQAAELIRLQLEAEGLKVLRAANAESALDLARQPLSLIALDVMLPGMDGWELLARLKRIPGLAHVPLVIISIAADNIKGISLGASAVLQKPISRAELQNTLAGLGLHAVEGRPVTVLVADDDPQAVEIIAKHLPEPAYSVVRAYGGSEAIEVARQRKPDLIVLDLMMPEVSGFDVVETLKDDPGTALIPIMVITAKQVTAEDRLALNGHVMRVMEKSEFNHGRFINEVRRVTAPPQIGS